ncbi:MAG: tetratricopeptide repeat protein [Armatimonadetes bacterium]|nr:tetratricopeptide repeat protein [Armatimonadota bacterium]
MKGQYQGLLLIVSLVGVAVVAGCRDQPPATHQLVSRADELFAARKFNEAYVLYRAAANGSTPNLHVLVRLADCCLWLQDAEKGHEWIDRALAADRNSALAWEKKGELYLAQGKHKEAIPCFKKALAFDGKLNVARLNLALAYEGAGQKDLALQVAREAVAAEPKSADVHFRYAVTLARLGRTADAEAGYRRALALNPDHVPALVELARHLVSQRRSLAEARKLAQRAYTLQPGEGEAAVLAAWALFLSGERKPALQELEQVAHSHPTNYEAWRRLSAGLRELGMVNAARRAAEIAAAVAPRAPAIMRERPAGRGR